jgi:DNA repair exonuclease SbcCD ATPase subunit
MSFKRSDLAALGIEPEKIQTLIDWHTETVKALQAKIAENEDNGDKLTKVQAELDKVKKDLETANKAIETANKEDYKGKYESATKQLEELKTEYATKETVANQKAKLTEQLKAEGYTDTATRLIVNRSDYASKIELDKDGKATNLDAIIKDIQADNDFSGFTPEVKEEKHTPATPPQNTGGKTKMSKSDIMSIKDDAERQQAIKDNLDVFGLDGDE